MMKKEFKKVTIRLRNHFTCDNCTTENKQKVVFFNSDDNVCPHCGSKDTVNLYQIVLKAEIDNWRKIK